jgi:hypothetical protein
MLKPQLGRSGVGLRTVRTYGVATHPVRRSIERVEGIDEFDSNDLLSLPLTCESGSDKRVHNRVCTLLDGFYQQGLFDVSASSGGWTTNTGASWTDAVLWIDPLVVFHSCLYQELSTVNHGE